MKRNYIAFLLAAVMLLSCIFMIAPTAYAETPTEDSSENSTENPSDTPSDETAEAPTDETAEEPDFFTGLLIEIIRFFKWLIPLVKAYI